jgi:hypothetical protein
MRRIIATFAVVMGFSLPFIGGCLSFGGNSAKADKPPETTIKTEKNTTTNTRTETETVRP